MGTLYLQVATDCAERAFDDWTTLWSQSGNMGNSWLVADVSVDDSDTKYSCLRFLGQSGSS